MKVAESYTRDLEKEVLELLREKITRLEKDLAESKQLANSRGEEIYSLGYQFRDISGALATAREEIKTLREDRFVIAKRVIEDGFNVCRENDKINTHAWNFGVLNFKADLEAQLEKECANGSAD